MQLDLLDQKKSQIIANGMKYNGNIMFLILSLHRLVCINFQMDFL